VVDEVNQFGGVIVVKEDGYTEYIREGERAAAQ